MLASLTECSSKASRATEHAHTANNYYHRNYTKSQKIRPPKSLTATLSNRNDLQNFLTAEKPVPISNKPIQYFPPLRNYVCCT